MLKAIDAEEATFWDVEISFRKRTATDVRRWCSTRDELMAIAAQGSGPVPSKADRSCLPGDLFCIPLMGGGFGIVIVARKRKWEVGNFHALLLYGFDRVFRTPPDIKEVDHLRPTDAVTIGVEASWCLDQGRWRRLGPLPGFLSSDWFYPPSVARWRPQGQSSGSLGDLRHVHFYDDESDQSVVLDFRGVIEGLNVEDIPSIGGLGGGRAIEGALPLAMTDPTYLSRVTITDRKIDLWRRMNEAWKQGLGKPSRFMSGP